MFIIVSIIGCDDDCDDCSNNSVHPFDSCKTFEDGENPSGSLTLESSQPAQKSVLHFNDDFTFTITYTIDNFSPNEEYKININVKGSENQGWFVDEFEVNDATGALTRTYNLSSIYLLESNDLLQPYHIIIELQQDITRPGSEFKCFRGLDGLYLVFMDQ